MPRIRTLLFYCVIALAAFIAASLTMLPASVAARPQPATPGSAIGEIVVSGRVELPTGSIDETWRRGDDRPLEVVVRGPVGSQQEVQVRAELENWRYRLTLPESAAGEYTFSVEPDSLVMERGAVRRMFKFVPERKRLTLGELDGVDLELQEVAVSTGRDGGTETAVGAGASRGDTPVVVGNPVERRGATDEPTALPRPDPTPSTAVSPR